MLSGRVRCTRTQQMAGIVEGEVDRIAAARPHREDGRGAAVDGFACFTASTRALPGCRYPRRFSQASVTASALVKGALSACAARRPVLLPSDPAVIAFAFAERAVLRVGDERAVAHAHGLAIVAGAAFGIDLSAKPSIVRGVEAAHRARRGTQYRLRPARRWPRARPTEQHFDQQ